MCRARVGRRRARQDPALDSGGGSPGSRSLISLFAARGPVAGVAVEWLMRLLRLEVGMGLRDGRVVVTVDVSREWWGVL